MVSKSSRTLRPYPTQLEPDFWSPDPPALDHRYALGRLGHNSTAANPLVVIGMNPSHANERTADETVNRVIAASIQLGYDGWAMFNLYPERASSPKRLQAFDQKLSDENCAVLKRFIQRHKVSEIFGAWGNLPNSTIRHAKPDVRATLLSLGTHVFYFGNLTTNGEPRHMTPRGPKLDLTGPKQYLRW